MVSTKHWNVWLVAGMWATAGAAAAVPAAADAAAKQPTAEAILAATGVKGGLVVHLGCADGKLTASLRVSESYLVHGLDSDAKHVAAARRHVHSLGLTGKVSVARLTGRRLPYVDNGVNVVVASDLDAVPMAEVMRVLCPNGVAYVRREGKWTKTVKPRPKTIDEWTHYLHDATNNAVAHDEVGPPRRLQWMGSPRWSRHHDHMSSVSAAVSSGGRVFYIFDEGSRSSILLPSKWKLIARDAFNGCLLWKRAVPRWHVRLWPLKSGPAQLTRRLVAVGERVYVTLGLGRPLAALDAATGRTVCTYEGTQATEEIIHSKGVLFALVRPKGVAYDLHRREEKYESVAAVRSHRRRWRWQAAATEVVALEAESGRCLWRTKSPVAQSTLAADDRSVYLHDGERVVCLDRTSGKERWRSMPLRWRSNHPGFAPSLVVYRDVVLFAGGDRQMTALSADTGKKLWTNKHHRGGHNSPEDLLVVDDLVWSAAIAGGGDSGIWTGYDLKTGETKREFPPDVKTYWFHHRCYRAKATDRYLLPSRTGIEFVDVRRKTWQIHHWVRGACLYGIMPCNGLIYAPQHPCACYPEAKLDGFNALAPASKGPRIPKDAAAQPRLERGPAYGEAPSAPANPQSPDWPTLRHDASRSGRTNAGVPTALKQAWKTDIAAGGKLSSLVVAAGKLFVAEVDRHTVHALDARTGKQVWSYTAGGRVDSPPTIYAGLALFGSADGYVYCLRASDGELAWRFRAAPIDQRLVSFEQVESVWPVHGSVLVQGGVCYFVAGRSLFLDDGLWLYRLEAKTGKTLSVTHMDDRNPETKKNLQDRVMVLNMPVAKPDILSCDGERLFMKSQVFDLSGRRKALGPHSGTPAQQGWVQRGEQAHLFCPSGFLDDAFWHRTYWVYGRSFAGGHAGYHQAGKFAPAGRILVFDDANVYGYGRKPQYYRWTTPIEHQLWSASKEAPEVPKPAARRRARRRAAREPAAAARVCVDKSASLNPTGKPLAVEAWVKADKGDGVVLARGGPKYGYALLLKGGMPRFAVRDEGKLGVAAAKEKIVGKWTHLAGVLTADKKLQIYVGGKLAGTGSAPNLISDDPHQAMEIGEDAGGAVGDYDSPLSFTGLIDEVRVYHGAVGAEQIARHCAEPGAKEAPKAQLVLSLTFDGGDAKDASGRGNHGRIEGAVSVEGKAGKALRFGPLPRSAKPRAPAPAAKGAAKPPAAKAPAKRRAAKPKAAGKAKAPAKPAPRKRPAAQRGFHVQHHWTVDLPLVVRAMVLAGDVLFIAGPPDVLDEEQAVRSFASEAIQAKLAAQDDALAGRKGALLWAVSVKDGRKLAELKLDTSPAWDAMAAAGDGTAAGGRLYFATLDGKVVCLTGR